MSAHSLAPGWRRFALADIEGSPWRNGGGLTRELCSGSLAGVPGQVQGSPAAALWDWRASVADIVQPGAFSLFPGIDRQAALAAGGALRLRTQNAVLDFATLGATQAFAGETALYAELPAGPVQLFNVMTRRGAARATLRALQGASTQAIDNHSALVLLCVRGTWRCNEIDGQLASGECLAVGSGEARLTLQPLCADACLLLAHIQPDAASA